MMTPTKFASLRTSAITAALMLGTFAVLIVPGYWLRHGEWIWEALTHV